jgi:hypothetical protein
VARLVGWPESQRIDAQQAAANRYNEAAQAHAGKVQGKVTVRADLEEAKGARATEGPGPQRVDALDAAALKGKAGIKADLYKAMQAQPQPQQSGTSRDGGKSR